MPDYEKCVMYKLVQKDNEKNCYVGSSCNYINRKYNHKIACNNEKGTNYNFNVYKFIRENGGWNNFEFVIIEKFPCKDKVEKLIRERYWVELIGNLNSVIPFRTKEETKILSTEKKNKWRVNNSEYSNEYYQKNKDKIKAQNKEKYTCPCGQTLTKVKKSRHEKTIKHKKYLETI